jgi:CRISPR-associated protein Cmr3
MSASNGKWTGAWFEPLGPLFFGDGRPFIAGETSGGRSVFPPSPATLQGVVRRLILESGCGRLDDYSRGCRTTDDADTRDCPEYGKCAARRLVGEHAADNINAVKGTLEVRGPFLAWRDAHDKITPLLPAPLDLVRETGGRKAGDVPIDGSVEVLTMQPGGKEEDKVCSMPSGLRPLVLRPEVKGLAGVGGWLTWERFKDYLSGALTTLERGKDWWLDADLWAADSRSGLVIDRRSRAASRGYLYFPQLVQLKAHTDGRQLVLLGAVDSDSATKVTWPSSLAVPLGGERKPARFGTCDAAWLDEPCPAEVGGSCRFKLVLTQPAWFKEGWRPGIDGATLVGARVERSESVGGWDAAARRFKPLRRFVPRGSVFYFELGASPGPKQVSAAASGYWNTCVSETPKDEMFLAYGKCGFGHAFVGKW